MHEITIANKIIAEAKKQGQVKAITIEVGDLAHLPAEDLRQTLHDLVDWNLTITKKPAQVKCACGYQGEPKILQRTHDLTLFECPNCGKIPEIQSGDQIIIKTVEVE